MNLFRRLFGRSESHPPQSVEPNEQAVLVYLDVTGLPEEVFEEYDVSSLEDQLIEVIELEGVGEFDGNEFGPAEVTLFMYGPDAERLFSAIEQVLRSHPLCKNARAVIRQGNPGAPQREVQM